MNQFFVNETDHFCVMGFRHNIRHNTDIQAIYSSNQLTRADSQAIKSSQPSGYVLTLIIRDFD